MRSDDDECRAHRRSTELPLYFCEACITLRRGCLAATTLFEDCTRASLVSSHPRGINFDARSWALTWSWARSYEQLGRFIAVFRDGSSRYFLVLWNGAHFERSRLNREIMKDYWRSYNTQNSSGINIVACLLWNKCSWCDTTPSTIASSSTNRDSMKILFKSKFH